MGPPWAIAGGPEVFNCSVFILCLAQSLAKNACSSGGRSFKSSIRSKYLNKGAIEYKKKKKGFYGVNKCLGAFGIDPIEH